MSGEPRLWVEIALPLPLGQTLTYSLSAAERRRARPGSRARVPVGKRKMVGFVTGFPETEPAGIVAKPIAGLLDRESPFPADLLELAHFAADYYLVPFGEMLAAMAPPSGVAWGERRVRLTDAGAVAPPRDDDEQALRDLLLDRGRLTFAEIEAVLPDLDLEAAVARAESGGRIELEDPGGRGARYVGAVELAPGSLGDLRARCGRSPAGRAVVDFLATLGRAALASEVEAGVGCGPAVLRRLTRLGVLRRFSQPEALSLDRHLLPPSRADGPAIVLRDDQAAAVEALNASIARRRFDRFVLQGMTGSGKTEVYLRAAASALARGGTALLLVPEIALVPALAAEATSRFGAAVAVLHSGLSAAERQQVWEAARSGRVRLVVGARSALFAPLPDLALVVVDEEQDLAYKQDVPPRYHGRDLALYRGKTAAATVVLVSATPSLETRLAAAESKLRPLLLTSRAGGAAPAEGILVDLRVAGGVARPGEVVFTDRLREELRRVLDDGDQAILLRNRRGYAPLLLCRACGEDFRCGQCGLPRTLHRRAGRLLCHYCGSSLPVPSRCPSCAGETLDPVGAGTERVEETLAELFPDAAIDVLDRDSARRSGGPAAILERFARGETRLLIGTQMISKGHHFPGVALTAVLSADAYLGFPDFRAVEKTYTLLTQVAGRSGRGERPGRFLIQTYLPQHYAIRATLERDDAAFAVQELRFRRAFHYPPFTRMVQLLSRDRSRERALERLERVATELGRRDRNGALRVTGPAPAPLERLRGEWRFQLMLRGSPGSLVRQAVREALGDRPPAGVAVDVDPYHLL